MRFKVETEGAETDYRTRQATDQRLDEVLTDLCILGTTWRLSSSQPAVPIQLRRTKLLPLAQGWQEFIVHSLVPTENKSEITVARAILIHAIMSEEDVWAEDIISDNMTVIVQALHGKGNLSFPSTIYKLCKDADFQPSFESQYHQDLQGIEEHLSSMQFLQQCFYENMQKSQAEYMEEVKEIKAKQEELWNNTNRFHSQIRKEKEMLVREIQEANPNLSEISVNHIPDLMQMNAERGRPMFFGALESHHGASSSSQLDQQEPVPLRTTPPLPGYQPPRPPPN
ncbi:hypothetical protein PIB30_097377 [Stylosanthes scabra]|uniref:Putative plant transposon protein domain-containing protein n=1 Tax=Stylosanthes scabra TaxID=79078 RepID=A0ABU6SX12_9FABA|nr:hypothetical protein [Stylosanthes scabra]